MRGRLSSLLRGDAPDRRTPAARRVYANGGAPAPVQSGPIKTSEARQGEAGGRWEGLMGKKAPPG